MSERPRRGDKIAINSSGVWVPNMYVSDYGDKFLTEPHIMVARRPFKRDETPRDLSVIADKVGETWDFARNRDMGEYDWEFIKSPKTHGNVPDPAVVGIGPDDIPISPPKKRGKKK